MKNFKKIAALLLMILVVCSFLTVSVFAAASESEEGNSGKLDMSLKPESFNDRLGYALQGTVTGMLMIFAVLTALTLILYGSKFIFYDMPNRKKQGKEHADKGQGVTVSEPVTSQTDISASESPTVVRADDDGEIAAVITAAIAAMIEGGEYGKEFVGGFRVVSFKKTNRGAWNRK